MEDAMRNANVHHNTKDKSWWTKYGAQLGVPVANGLSSAEQSSTPMSLT